MCDRVRREIEKGRHDPLRADGLWVVAARLVGAGRMKSCDGRAEHGPWSPCGEQVTMWSSPSGMDVAGLGFLSLTDEGVTGWDERHVAWVCDGGTVVAGRSEERDSPQESESCRSLPAVGEDKEPSDESGDEHGVCSVVCAEAVRAGGGEWVRWAWPDG